MPRYRRRLALRKSCSPVQEHSQEHSQEDSPFIFAQQFEEETRSGDDSTPQTDDDGSTNTLSYPRPASACSQVTILDTGGNIPVFLPDCCFGETEITEAGCAACFDAMEKLHGLYTQLPEKALALTIKKKDSEKSLREIIVWTHNELEYFFTSCSQRKAKAKGTQGLELAVKHLVKALKQAHKDQLAYCPKPLISALKKKVAISMQAYSKAPDFVKPKKLKHCFSFDLVGQLLVPVVNAQLYIHKNFGADPAETLFTLRQKCCSSFVRKYLATDHFEHWAMSLLFNCTIDKNLTGRVLAGYFSETSISSDPTDETCLTIFKQQMSRVFAAMEDWRDLIKDYHGGRSAEIEEETRNFKILASTLSKQSSYASSIEDIQQLDIIAGVMMSWLTVEGRLALPCWVSGYAERFRFYYLIKGDSPKDKLKLKHIPATLRPYIQRLAIPVIFKISWSSGEQLAERIRNPSHRYHQKWPVIRVDERTIAETAVAVPDLPPKAIPSPTAGKHLESIASTKTKQRLPPDELVSLAWLYFYRLSVYGDQDDASRVIATTVDGIFQLFELIKAASDSTTLPQDQVKICARVATTLYPLCEEAAFQQQSPTHLQHHPIIAQLRTIPDNIDTLENPEDLTSRTLHELGIIVFSGNASFCPIVSCDD
ncbi:hypothetical protein [Spongorhabdus nitratireducens]